jgi:replication factor C subunit 1
MSLDLSIFLVWPNFVVQSAVEEVIEQMDEYYLSKEDWDTIVELGVDDRKDDFVLKKISSATKAALTRK